MATKNNKKEPIIKNKTEIYKAIISCALVLLLVLIFGLAFQKVSVEDTTQVSVKKQTEDLSFYDDQICRCIERERARCNEGFELDDENRTCRNGTEKTNVILSCSKFECARTIYSFRSENGSWVKETVE